MSELQEAAEVRNHWWPREGWHPGRLVYTWHLTFEHAPELHRLVERYQATLSGLQGLDPVPTQWLHLTIQGVAFADELTQSQIDEIVTAVTLELETVPAFQLTFGKTAIIGEAIVLPPTPAEPVHEVWRAIRSGIANVLGREKVPTAHEQSTGFRPHVSIAYVNTSGPAAIYREALEAMGQVDPASASVTDVALIVQDRVLAPEWVYRWTTAATVRLGGSMQQECPGTG
ncbi:2'-5' RNA ligase family protein [Nonomuraea sp. B1E8]|uniref:2'-5' RNA ligase family protein n=1 Tax=unclassified Nonomuraea TaxID=2593643 RepID=UPI00325D0886